MSIVVEGNEQFIDMKLFVVLPETQFMGRLIQFFVAPSRITEASLESAMRLMLERVAQPLIHGMVDTINYSNIYGQPCLSKCYLSCRQETGNALGQG